MQNGDVNDRNMCADYVFPYRQSWPVSRRQYPSVGAQPAWLSVAKLDAQIRNYGTVASPERPSVGEC